MAAATQDPASLAVPGRSRGGSGAIPPPRAGRPFLPLPPKLTGRTRRIHQVVLGVILVLGAIQGTYWSITTVAWSPADEAVHFAYVESMARGHGVPTIGVDPVSDQVLAAVKEVPTNTYRSDPVAPNNTDPRWSSGRVPYEAVHGPVYYAAMVPFFWIGQPLGIDGSLFTVRLGTVLFTIAAIPLTWLLARRLFPRQPVVWLIAAALLATVNSLSAGAVSNDSATMVVGTIAVLAFLRALNRPDHLIGIAMAGAAFSLTLLTKTTSIVLVPFLAIAFVAAAVVTRPRISSVLRWMGLFAAGAAIVLAPWVAWNLITYGALSGSEAIVRTVGSPLLGTPTFDRPTIEQHAAISRMGLWLAPLLYNPDYTGFWEWTAGLALVLGGLAAALRRRWRDLGVLVWCASAIPLGFIALEAIFYGPFSGNGGPVGRHLWVALPQATVMISAAVVLLVGTRVAPVVGAWMVAASLWLQVPVADWFVDVSYLTTSLDGGLGPVVVQDHADQFFFDRLAVVVDAGCPVRALGIGFTGAPPSSLTVSSGGSGATATGGATVAFIPTYHLDRPMEGPITVALPPGSIMRATTEDRTDRASFDTGGGDPVVMAYCEVDDADARSFEVSYRNGHPDWVSMATLRTIPRLVAGAGVIAAVGVTAAVSIGAIRRRRSGASGPGSGSAPAATAPPPP